MILYLDNQPHTNFGLVLLEGQTTQMITSPNRRTVNVPRRNGQYHYGSTLSAKQLNYPAMFVTETREQLDAAISTFARFLVDEDGSPRDIKLHTSTQPDRAYTVQVSSNMDVDKELGMGEFTLSFVADDPYPKGDKRTINNMSTPTTITNPGTLKSYPTFTATCKVTTKQFFLWNGSIELRINYSFKVGDVIVIDMARNSITINGQRAMQYLDWNISEFFPLSPSTNRISYTGVTYFTVSMAYEPRYI